jgi:hypothetical protein
MGRERLRKNCDGPVFTALCDKQWEAREMFLRTFILVWGYDSVAENSATGTWL